MHCRARRDKKTKQNKNSKGRAKEGRAVLQTVLLCGERLVTLWVEGARELRLDTGRVNQPVRQCLLRIVLVRQVASHKTRTRR